MHTMAGTLEALEGKLRFYEQNIFHLKECAPPPLALVPSVPY